MLFSIGKTYDNTLQNYAITADPVSLTSSTVNLSLKGNTATIKIKKVDKDTNEPIKDTTYQLIKDGKVIATGTTDKNGNLTFKDLYQYNYVVKEIKSNDNYVISKETVNIKAIYNKVTEKTLTNEHKKGKIKVVKVDQDNNKIKLAGVKFNVYDENNKVVQSLTTDKNRSSNNKRTASQ